MTIKEVEWKYSSADTIQRPQKTAHTNFDKRDPGLWVDMQPLKIDYQTIYDIRGGSVNTSESEKGPTFRFLAPMSFMEGINHNWDEYDSVATRLAQKLMDVNKISSEITGLAQVDWLGAVSDIGSVSKTKIENMYSTGMRQANKMVQKVGGTRIPQVRFDSPLVYTSSPRRTYTLEFVLISETDDPKGDILTPVREIEKYASPGTDPQGPINIKLPYVFRIKTYPDPEVLKIDNAALTSVQPTFFEPYRKGYPTRCELTLNFTDITPVYRESIQEGGLIRVKSPTDYTNEALAAAGINPEDIG